jgi:sec-independent protein translocase protein TatB
MFDIGWSEMLLIAIVAIIFIGPKEIPAAMRAVGRIMGKARLITREFRATIDEMMRETELDELRRQVEKAAGPMVDDEQTIASRPQGSGAEAGLPARTEAGEGTPEAKPGPPAAKPEPPAESPKQQQPRLGGQDGPVG